MGRILRLLHCIKSHHIGPSQISFSAKLRVQQIVVVYTDKQLPVLNGFSPSARDGDITRQGTTGEGRSMIAEPEMRA